MAKMKNRIIPDEADDLRKEMGISSRPAFQDGPPTRAVDCQEIRSLHLHQLSAKKAKEIELLILNFREWHEADKQVLIELAKEINQTVNQQNKTDSQGNSESSGEGKA